MNKSLRKATDQPIRLGGINIQVSDLELVRHREGNQQRRQAIFQAIADAVIAVLPQVNDKPIEEILVRQPAIADRIVRALLTKGSCDAEVSAFANLLVEGAQIHPIGKNLDPRLGFTRCTVTTLAERGHTQDAKAAASADRARTYFGPPSAQANVRVQPAQKEPVTGIEPRIRRSSR